MTVDETLARGWYTDRCGREWKRGPSFVCNRDWSYQNGIYKAGYANDAEMRLLIERDQHLDECEGLYGCDDHPVPKVTRRRRVVGGRRFWVWSPFDSRGVCASTPTLPEAMDAARALAVGE